jgi:hypothetical protein
MNELVPDSALLVAVERRVTGASSHQLRNLVHQYQLACYVGNEPKAKSTELILRRALLEKYLPQSA